MIKSLKCLQNTARAVLAPYLNILGTDISFTFYVAISKDHYIHMSIFIINKSTCEIYGCIRLNYNDLQEEFGIICDLSVCPKYRKKGYATRLIEVAEKMAKGYGLDQCFIEVKKHTWLSPWFKRMGYLKDKKHSTDRDAVLYKMINNLKIEQ